MKIVKDISIGDGKKICNKCEEPRSIDEFYENHNCCKVCVIEKQRKRRHTKSGLIAFMHSGQIQKSKQRNHPAPAYSKQDLKDWLYAQVDFHRLFHLWEVSGYDTWLKPSVDRIEDEYGYNFGNIQLMTWKENSEKGVAERSKEVAQYDLNWNLIDIFPSTSEAARQTGISAESIRGTCVRRTGKSSACGYKWEYTNNIGEQI